MNTFTVGQQLWYVPSRKYARPEYVEVEKIGRVWITLRGGDRIDRQTLLADGRGYASPGQCYFSKEDYEREVALDTAWGSLRRAIDRGRPKHLTLEQILQTHRMLSASQQDDQ